MQAEFETAVEDGRPLAFATGCLIAACREMPVHASGRFALASHALVLGLILPMAALLFTSALLGFPYLQFTDPGLLGILTGAGEPRLLLNDGDVAVAPSLTLLVLLIALGHLLVAWHLLERDWDRAADFARLGAAATTSLVIFNATLYLDPRMLLPVLCLATQAVAVRALVRWHDRACRGDALEGTF